MTSIPDYNFTDADGDTLRIADNYQGVIFVETHDSGVCMPVEEIPAAIKALASRLDNPALVAAINEVIEAHVDLKAKGLAVELYNASVGYKGVSRFANFTSSNKVTWLAVAKKALELTKK